MSSNRYPAVAESPAVEKALKSRWSDQSLNQRMSSDRKLSAEKRGPDKKTNSLAHKSTAVSIRSTASSARKDPVDRLDNPIISSRDLPAALIESHSPRTDKASRILGIKHRRSMEPIPASTRTSIVSSRSAKLADPMPPASGPAFPLTSLYIVSGLPKSPHTWTLADPDSVAGLHHSEGAVTRWWRPEVLGSTVSPGAGGGGPSKRKRKGKVEEGFNAAGYLNKQDIGKILSKSLKVNHLCCLPRLILF